MDINVSKMAKKSQDFSYAYKDYKIGKNLRKRILIKMNHQITMHKLHIQE